MSDETLRLLTSSEALDAYLVGLGGLALLGLLAVVGKRPGPAGGLVLSASAVIALAWTYRVPAEVVAGLGLLVLGGLVPVRSPWLAMALSVPGATVLGAAFLDSPHPELVVLVVAGTVVLGGLVARFDDQDVPATGMTLLVISYVGVLLVVPDTDQVIVVVAAAAPLLVVGYPLRIARIGPGGAQAATGLLLWSVAVGGVARTAALISGAAALGLLIADPLLRKTSAGGSDRSTLSLVAVQALICVLLALVMSLIPGQALVVAVVAAGLLLAAGLSAQRI